MKNEPSQSLPHGRHTGHLHRSIEVCRNYYIEHTKPIDILIDRHEKRQQKLYIHMGVAQIKMDFLSVLYYYMLKLFEPLYR